MTATTQTPAPLFGTEDLITSTVATPKETKPHTLRVVDLYINGDKQGAHCVVCDAYGELNALRDLGPYAYGCTQVPAFESPAPQWM
ncbi:hypothetical protein ACFW2K_22780 [Streptomyces nigra]|uniref:hypothetical protein n=1 Tax=Streptomyces nigra TaxID=1827580 RepID=UPI0036AD0EA2